MHNIEYKAISINTTKIENLIICAYYSPRGLTLKELINNLKIVSDNVILLGDFNAKHTSLGSLVSNY